MEIGIPVEDGRLDILHNHTRGMPLTDDDAVTNDVELRYFVKRSI